MPRESPATVRFAGEVSHIALGVRVSSLPIPPRFSPPFFPATVPLPPLRLFLTSCRRGLGTMACQFPLQWRLRCSSPLPHCASLTLFHPGPSASSHARATLVAPWCRSVSETAPGGPRYRPSLRLSTPLVTPSRLGRSRLRPVDCFRRPLPAPPSVSILSPSCAPTFLHCRRCPRSPFGPSGIWSPCFGRARAR